MKMFCEFLVVLLLGFGLISLNAGCGKDQSPELPAAEGQAESGKQQAAEEVEKEENVFKKSEEKFLLEEPVPPAPGDPEFEQTQEPVQAQTQKQSQKQSQKQVQQK